MKSIFICGYGYVGKAMVELLKSYYQIIIYDPLYPTLKKENLEFVSDLKKSKECFLSIICAPTPSKENGECDISYVESCVKELESPLILIKSTIEIGTTDNLKEKYKKRIIFSPEYVGESRYFNPYFSKDMKETPMFILGGNKEDTSKIVDIFVPILGPTKFYYQTSAKVAEIAKYMENTFFALKVTFCNEIFEICEKSGVDYWDVREAWLLDPRINRMHTAVLREERGFGGKCYPKDVKALIKYAEKIDYEPKLLKEIISSNEKFRKNGY